MEIALLEKDTLTVGDMDFSPFETLGKINYYDTIIKQILDIIQILWYTNN